MGLSEVSWICLRRDNLCVCRSTVMGCCNEQRTGWVIFCGRAWKCLRSCKFGPVKWLTAYKSISKSSFRRCLDTDFQHAWKFRSNSCRAPQSARPANGAVMKTFHVKVSALSWWRLTITTHAWHEYKGERLYYEIYLPSWFSQAVRMTKEGSEDKRGTCRVEILGHSLSAAERHSFHKRARAIKPRTWSFCSVCVLLMQEEIHCESAADYCQRSCMHTFLASALVKQRFTLM